MTAPTQSDVAAKRSIQLAGLEVHNLLPVLDEEAFLQLCQDNPDLRIEQDKQGNLIVMSPVSLDSGNYEGEALLELGVWNREHQLGYIYSASTLFILPDGEKRMPDAAWIARERVEQLTAKERRSFAHIVPDFVIEVRSPSDLTENLKKKITEIWLANGVRLAWLLDPIEGKHWIYRANGSVDIVDGVEGTLSGEDVLPGFTFPLSLLTPRP